ncbi:Holliday junction resolvase RecU [Lactobacillus bombicola]|uniref:Holliday junction resolvase RecU n=1 Tax=Lactobacillus bombicola TaxID=1505723 RepID=A0A396ST84_9LACO|nr:Holliday junction resolvase RecU [Lactobacillus bombicola]RHW50527.1 Holliday junction resolvase RecU [Lactobacillus bombicola]RHW52964.1 Holliday junction resolvase RecU [Lactobacillus bombicola]RHW54634.1 Holliday junction resolvase RecU [Lactobacillus bombicola]
MVKYPNGTFAAFRKSVGDPTFKKNQKSNNYRKNISFSDRGMTLEQMINESNKFYRLKEIAVVHKKPTPIQIVKVDYPKRSRAVIKEAYFRQESTTDYNGVYNGYYLDFEAKETKNKTSFPLKNFHEHQIVHLTECLKQKGICFTIIGFTSLNRYFVTPANMIAKAWWTQNKSSVTLTEIEEWSVEIESGFQPTLPYLEAVDYFIADRKSKNGKYKI